MLLLMPRREANAKGRGEPHARRGGGPGREKGKPPAPLLPTDLPMEKSVGGNAGVFGVSIVICKGL